MIEQLIEKIKSELTTISKSYEPGEAESFYFWMKLEYDKYMSCSRETFLETLDLLEDKYPTYKSLIDVLRNNINEYGSTQAYYRAAIELTKI